MRRLSFFAVIFCITLSPYIGVTRPTYAMSCDDPRPTEETQLQEYIADCTTKLNSLSGQKQTLAAALNYINTQIKLTQAKIVSNEAELKTLETEILDLSGKISSLNFSLDDITKLFIARVRTSYMHAVNWNISFLSEVSGLQGLLQRIEYAEKVRDHDSQLLIALEHSRLEFDAQKSAKEKKQAAVIAVKAKLAGDQNALRDQQASKNQLLSQTQNDEKKYNSLLNEAAAELNALLNSKFTEKRNVKKGDVIGIMGSTGNSTGAHLHFGVYNLREGDTFNYYASQNPLEYLSSKSVYIENTACDDVVGGSVTKDIGSGSHSWPMDTVRVTQCWGHTPWSRYYSTNFHDGLDIVDTSKIVRATDDGVAHVYRGVTAMGNNVRVYHPDGKMTLYLHLQ